MLTIRTSWLASQNSYSCLATSAGLTWSVQKIYTPSTLFVYPPSLLCVMVGGARAFCACAIWWIVEAQQRNYFCSSVFSTAVPSSFSSTSSDWGAPSSAGSLSPPVPPPSSFVSPSSTPSPSPSPSPSSSPSPASSVSVAVGGVSTVVGVASVVVGGASVAVGVAYITHYVCRWVACKLLKYASFSHSYRGKQLMPAA